MQTAIAVPVEHLLVLAAALFLLGLTGVLVRRNVDPGEVAIQGVLNNPGSLLMTVADLSRMEVEVDVDETDIVSIAIGQQAEVERDAFPDRSFAGQVTEVARSAKPGSAGQEQSADFQVVVTLAEIDPAMRPGLSATARITTATREDSLAIPIQARCFSRRYPYRYWTGGSVPTSSGTQTATTFRRAGPVADSSEWSRPLVS